MAFKDMNDLMLEYICGATSYNSDGGGLKQLREITLPKKCFVTHNGFKVHSRNSRALLENLPLLEKINHPGKMGVLFEGEDDLKPTFEGFLRLVEFSQLESMSSGGIIDLDDWFGDEDSDEDEFDITPWIPSDRAISRIKRWCPNLIVIRVLIEDNQLNRLCNIGDKVEEIEACVQWNGTSGIDLLCISLHQTLNKIYLTLLDGYSYSVIEAIGRNCTNVSTFHLDIWSEEIDDADILTDMSQKDHFLQLRDLKVKCEDQVEYLSPCLFNYFFAPSIHELNVVQYVAPLDWLTEKRFQSVVETCLVNVEMVIISNTSTREMQLGIESVHHLLRVALKLTLLGNLKSWSRIDHYNASSDFYFKTESQLSKLKEDSVKRNWDISFDFEDIDFLYK